MGIKHRADSGFRKFQILSKHSLSDKVAIPKCPTFHSVPRINHGNKRLNAVNKMMVGPSESLYRRWL